MATSPYTAALDERAHVIAEIERNLAEAEEAGRMDEKHRKADDKLAVRLAQLNAQIEAEEARQAEQRSVFERQEPDAHTTTRVQHARSPKWADVFGQPRENYGFKTLHEFLTPLPQGAWDQRYAAMIGGPGDTSGSGLMVPEQFAAELMDGALESEIVRPRARVFPMMSDTLRVAGFRLGDGGEPYGIAASWTRAGGAIPEADPSVRGVTLNANSLKALLQLTQEHVDDAAGGSGPSADQQVSTMLPAGIAWHADNAFLRGTGVGSPLGMLSSGNPARVLVAKESGQAADTIVYENVVNLFARLHTSCVGRSFWLAHPSTLPQLLTLSVPIGTGGVFVPVLQKGPTGYEMLTRPLVISEKASPLGDEGDLSLLDASQYAIGLRREMRLEKSMHAGFSTDSVYYRAVLRLDGTPLWTTTYQPANSAPTLSPFVTLAARA